MRSILFALVIILGGCAHLDLIPHVQESTKYVNVTLDEAYLKDKSFHSYVKLWEDTDYSWIIQEITLSSGVTIVECFYTPDGQLLPWQRDYHYMETPWPYHMRSMVVYPGEVEGADTTILGFAMLPENRDGSVKTTTGLLFNEQYRKNHKLQGRIVDCDKSMGVTWTLVYDCGKMTIWLPDGSIHIYVDPIWYKED